MEAQLDFTWQPEPVVWKPSPIIHEEPQYYEMPQQLDFKAADLPQIPSEKPAPLVFTNGGGGKKLIQFAGVPAKTQVNKSQSNARPKVTKTTFVKKPVRPADEPKPKPKPEWNDKVGTVGLFDPGISKKVPIEVKHAIKKENEKKPRRPETFDDINALPTKISNKKKNVRKTESTGNLQDNLEIKFIQDQEEIVKKLERQLEDEKNARKRLDEQFENKLKEIEVINKRMKGMQSAQIPPAINYGIKNQTKPKSAKTLDGRAEANLQVIKSTRVDSKGPRAITTSDVYYPDNQRPGSTENLGYNNKYGNVYEPPTHDITPAVLKAQRPLNIPKALSAKEPLRKSPIKTSENNTKTSDVAVIRQARKSEMSPKNGVRKAETVAAKHENDKFEIREPSPIGYMPMSMNMRNFEVTDLPQNDPILNSLTAAMVRFKAADDYANHPSVGLISRVGAKYIAYYANELSEMFIDDFLEDIVHDLQRIETLKALQLHDDFQNEAEKNLNEVIQNFHQETQKVQSKYQVKTTIKKFDLKVEESDELMIIEDKRRDWEISLDDQVLANIRKYRKNFEDFQKIFAGGSDGKLWNVYAVIGDDIMDEVIAEVANEYDSLLDEFTERLINQEFS